jgi:hypothetical protein
MPMDEEGEMIRKVEENRKMRWGERGSRSEVVFSLDLYKCRD